MGKKIRGRWLVFHFALGTPIPRDPEDIEARKTKPLLDTEADSAKSHAYRKLWTNRKGPYVSGAPQRHMRRRLRAASDEVCSGPSAAHCCRV